MFMIYCRHYVFPRSLDWRSYFVYGATHFQYSGNAVKSMLKHQKSRNLKNGSRRRAKASILSIVIMNAESGRYQGEPDWYFIGLRKNIRSDISPFVKFAQADNSPCVVLQDRPNLRLYCIKIHHHLLTKADRYLLMISKSLIISLLTLIYRKDGSFVCFFPFHYWL